MLAIIACIVMTIWLLPLALKAKINKRTIVRVVLGLLIGGIPVAFTAMYFNILVGAKLFGGVTLTVEQYCVINSLSVGFVEESVKLLGALGCVYAFTSNRKIDYILIFGAVGAGFEIAETFAYSDNIISSLPRIVLALHIVWLMYDGSKCFEMRNGKPLALVKSYLLTIVLHALFDCGLMMLQHSDIREEIVLIGFVMATIGHLANIMFMIKTIKMARKEAKVQIITE